MDFKNLIYKHDDATSTNRISKTKVITIAVFIIFFIWSFPDFLKNGIFSAILSSILVGLIFAIPTFIVGFIIGKIINSTNNSSLNKKAPNNKAEKINSYKTQKTTSKKVNNPSVNNYAAMFRSQMEISGGHPSENDSLHSLVEEWEKNFPDDKNLFFAKAILASGNLFMSKDKILDLIGEGEYAPTMYDSSNYVWFYDTEIGRAHV